MDTRLGAEINCSTGEGWIISETLREGEYRDVEMTCPFVTGSIKPNKLHFEKVTLTYSDRIEGRARFSIRCVFSHMQEV